MTNTQIAEIFLRIGDLMEYRAENGFKVRSYWRAAETILALSRPLTEIAAQSKLAELPGVGEAIAGKIGEILATGTCALYERLRAETPPNIQDLVRTSALTPRLVRILEVERGVADRESLLRVASGGDLETIPNLNAGDRAQILRAAFMETEANEKSVSCK